jgi:putative ABC transport system ATP-binding protein
LALEYAVSLIELENVSRSYKVGNNEVCALQATSLSIDDGEFVVFLGPSGSGKTTLLNLIAALDQPTSGRVEVNGINLSLLDRRERTNFRRLHAGVVFQFHNLIPTLTARENVEIVASMVGKIKEVPEALARVGLAGRMDHFPHEMSGGEQQRVAIARALVKDPPIILGDEPTGNLDAATGQNVIQLLWDIHKQGKCILIVTHNNAMVQVATRIISMRDGRVQSDKRNAAPLSPQEVEW